MAEDGLPVLEHGRYRLWQTPDGGWLLGRAAFTCDRCQSCGCGDQQPHVTVPGMLVKMAEAMQRGEGPPSPLAVMMRKVMGRGRRGDGTGDSGSAETAEGGDPAGGDLAGVPAAGLPDQEGRSGSGDGGETAAGQV